HTSQTLPGLETLASRALHNEAPVARYLQQRIQQFFWQNDSESYPPTRDELMSDELGEAVDLEAAVLLGRIDFDVERSARPAIRPNAEHTLLIFADLISTGR